MKNFITYLFFIISISLYADDGPTIGSVTDPVSSVHLTYLKACDEWQDSCIKAHVYLKFQLDPTLQEKYLEITDRVEFVAQWSDNGDSANEESDDGTGFLVDPYSGEYVSFNDRGVVSTKVIKGYNGFEIEAYNKCIDKKVVNILYEGYDKEGNRIFQGTKDAEVTAEDDGIIDVSEHFDNELEEWSTRSSESLIQHFCGKKISQIELLSFFKEQLDLTTEEMCMFLTQYNIQTTLEVEQNVNYIWKHELCKKFEDWIKNNGGSDDCKCKLIRTKSSALNIGTANGGVFTDDCTTYEAAVDGENRDHNDKNDYVVSQGRFGAAKAMTVNARYDGGDESSNETLETVAGWSTLRFRSVCIDPTTIAFNPDNCVCEKEVEIEYGYFSRISARAQTWGCFLCAQEAAVSVRDWATVIIENGGSSSVIDTGGDELSVACDIPTDDATLDGFLTDATEAAVAIGAAIGGASIQTIAAAATSVANLVATNFLENRCGETIERNWQIRGGEVFSLLPGDQMRITISSTAQMNAFANNNGEAFGKVNSSFYLAAVLKTVEDPDLGVPEYCECEQIGSYVYGGLDPFTPALDFNVNEPERMHWTEWGEIFDVVTLTMDDMAAMAGSFIGTAGVWFDAFETNGCCDVILPCHSDCVFIRGCDEISIGLDGDDDFDLRSSLNDVKYEGLPKVKIYPNPADEDVVKVSSETNQLIYSIEIFDLQGRKISDQKEINKLEHSLQLTNLNPGTYLLVVSNNQGLRTTKKFVKL